MLEAEVAAASQNDDPRRLADLLGQLGSNLEAVGQRERGIEVLSRSVALYEGQGDLNGVASGLARAARRIARWRQVRVTRILSQPLGQLGHLLDQCRHLGGQGRDLGALGEQRSLELGVLGDERGLELGILGSEDGLKLGDPLLRVQRTT